MNSLTSEKLIATLLDMDVNLKVDHIDPDADLFVIGMDSLDMMNFFFAIEEKFNIQINIDPDEYHPTDWSTINKILKNIN